MRIGLKKTYLLWLSSAVIGGLVTWSNSWAWYDFASITLAVYFTIKLISGIGRTLPIRELAAFTYVVQILIGSLLTYKYFPDIKIGFMAVSEERYYPFALLSVIAFVIGLFFPVLKYHKVDLRGLLANSVLKKSELWGPFGYALIAISFVTGLLLNDSRGGSLAFVAVLVHYFRFIGLFYVWSARVKYRKFIAAMIFIPFIIESLSGGLFIELFMWGFLTYSVYELGRPLNIRRNLLVIASGVFLVFVLQAVKADYRRITWRTDVEISVVQRLTTLADLVLNLKTSDESTRKLANARFVVRINQGYIVSHILKQIPQRMDFVNGEYFKKELAAIFIPRFLAPDKVEVGDREKFRRFAGWRLDKRVAMSVSILGDGYANFGFYGGIFFCFVNGLLLNFLVNLGLKLSVSKEPSLIFWMPLIFAFSMRCGDEFYIITNHIVKSSVLIFLILFAAKKTGKL